MASKGAPKQDGVVGAIVLAVSQTKLKGLADRNTLKAVVGGQYKDLVVDGVIKLQVLWNLLKDLPGFEEEDAKAAFCAIKSWESALVLRVELPKELAEMSDEDRMKAAAHCSATESQKKQALFPEATPVSAMPVPAGGASTNRTRSTQAKVIKEVNRTKQLVTVLVLAILIGGGVTAAKMLSGGDKKVDLSSIATDIPIKSATRRGSTLDLRLTSEDWFTTPGERRKASLDATLRAVATIQVDTIIIYDSTGNLKATALWIGNPPQIAIRLKK